MLEYKDYEEKIKKLTRLNFMHKNKIVSFFEKAFTQFNMSDQKKILEVFEKSNSISRWNIFLEHNKNVKKIILSESEKYLNIFLTESDITKSFDFAKFAEVYLNTNNNNLNDDLITSILQKISNITAKDINIIKTTEVKNILAYYIKELAWNSHNDEYINNIKNGESYKIFEQLLCEFIESVDCKDNLYNNELLVLLSETQNAIGSESIVKKINEKFPVKIDLDKYDVKNISEDEKENLYNDLIIYRMQNGIIPKDFCIYLTNCENNKMLRRISNIDYIKYYLKENQLENATVFFDEQLMFPGIANFRRLALNNKKLNEQSFHEATHVIQQENLLVRRDFSENKYAMLKDFILQKRVDWQVYNSNHSRWLFEIDADIEGAKHYYQYLKDIEGIFPGNSEMSVDEINECIEFKTVEKERRIQDSKTINIDGEEKNKSQLFDEILMREPELLMKHPILQIEYNPDGSRKTLGKVLASIEQKYTIDKNEEEILGIANCIFCDVQSISDNEYAEFASYISNSTIISSIKKQVIKQVEQLKKTKSMLQLGIESIGSIETTYIDQTAQGIEMQDKMLREGQTQDSQNL